MKIDPENPYALINLGVVCEREGDVAGARKLYDKVLRLKAEQANGEPEGNESIRRVARDNIEQLDKEQPVETTP